jgi:hypothetical protein
MVANSGDGDAFLSHVALEANSPPTLSQTYRIGIMVAPGAVVNHESPVGNLSLVAGPDEKSWKSIVGRATNTKDPCYIMVFYSMKDHAYLQLGDAYRGKFWNIPAAATLHSYSVKTGKSLNREFSVAAGVARRKLDECQNTPATSHCHTPTNLITISLTLVGNDADRPPPHVPRQSCGGPAPGVMDDEAVAPCASRRGGSTRSGPQRCPR